MCGCNKPIGDCAPYANKKDVEDALQSLCSDCFADLTGVLNLTTDDFCRVGFPNGTSDCCEYFIVKHGKNVWFSNNCSDWQIISSDFDCFEEVPSGTLVENFCSVAFPIISSNPQVQNEYINDVCTALFIRRGDEIWISDSSCDWICLNCSGNGANDISSSNTANYKWERAVDHPRSDSSNWQVHLPAPISGGFLGEILCGAPGDVVNVHYQTSYLALNPINNNTTSRLRFRLIDVNNTVIAKSEEYYINNQIISGGFSVKLNAYGNVYLSIEYIASNAGARLKTTATATLMRPNPALYNDVNCPQP